MLRDWQVYRTLYLKRAEVILESLEDQSHDASDLNNRVMGAQPNNVVEASY